jgi:uncharacterized RDD family membrane protein YckC
MSNPTDATLPNPYAPPAESLELGEIDPTLGHSEKVEADLASFGQRVGNFVIDQIAGRIMATLVLGAIPVEWMLSWDLGRAGLKLVILLLDAGFFVAYYSLLEGLTGRTIGKWITRTRVVGLQGERVPFGRIVARSVARFIPFDALSFLLADAGWHDRLSRTRVVRVPRS